MLRFTIRDVLLLTAIVALAVGWWLDHRRQSAEIQRLQSPVAGFDIQAIEEFQSNQPLPP